MYYTYASGHALRRAPKSVGEFYTTSTVHAHKQGGEAMASSADSGDGDPSIEGGTASRQPPAPQGSVTSVRVAVRVRPLVSMETAAGCQECMFGDSDNNQARE